MNVSTKKICFFSGDISRSGGTERVSSIIANGLADRGYNITILSYKYGENSFYKLNENIKLDSLHMEKYSGFFQRKLYPFILLNRFIKKNKIDILIDIDILLSLYTLPQKIFTSVKVISWEHFNFYNRKVKNRVRARLLATQFSDLIIVLNRTDFENYKKNIKRIKNITYIYNPAICKREKYSYLESKKIISIGRLCEEKNFGKLLDIWKEVNTEIDGWILQIIGSGENEVLLKNKIQEENIPNVEMIPFQEDIETYYEEASIYIMTSRYEGFPMVLLEAQKKGLPIVSFDCPTGPAEIIRDNINGFLIESGDDERMKEKLIALMNDEKLRRYLGRNALKDSDRFNLDKILNEWCNIIGNI